MKHIVLRIKTLFEARRVLVTAVVAVFGLCLVAAIAIGVTSTAQAAPGVYKTVNFQGKVVSTSGINVPDASYTFKFRIYTSATGDTAIPCSTTCLWEESKSLTTVNGIFQTNLGDTTALPGSVNFNTDSLYIGVVFNGDTEMTPRIRLTSVPYAFNADMLDGLDSSSLVQLSPSAQQTGTINVSGNITSGAAVNAAAIDSAVGGTALTLGSANASGITLAKNTTMSSSFTMSLQGNNSLNLGSTTAAGGIVFRDGTANNRQVTLSTIGLTASYSINLPASAPTAGLQCLQTANASTTNLMFGSCSGGNAYISLQSSTPGTAETGNFNITGVGIAASYQAGFFDQASAAVLNIGTVNASSITIGKSGFSTTVAGTLNVQDLNVGSNRSVVFTGGSGNFNQSASSGTFSTGTGTVALNGNTTIASGRTLIVNGDTTIRSSSATALSVQNAAGTATLFAFDTSTGNLSLGSGASRTIAIAASAAGAGTDLTLRGSAAGTGNVNGGNLILSGGAGTGTGVQGLVNLSTAAFSASPLQTNSIAAGIVDQYSSIPVTANTTNLTISVPVPLSAVTGRVLYVTAAGGSNDFTISLGGTSIAIAMKANSTATLIWNGTGWTAAGASSSTDLQSAYNNTLTSAGGAEIVLNGSGGNADGFTIRNNATTPITGGLLEVQSAIGTNLLSVNNNATELAANGGAETAASFGTAWTAIGAATVTRNTTLANVATGQASAQVATTTAINTGIRNNLVANPAVSTTYQVSFTGLLGGGSFTTLDVDYSRDGGTTLTACTNVSTTTLVTTGWSKVTCTFTTDATTATNPDLIIRQTDATARTFWVDNLSVTILTATSTPPNVQIGGGLYGGAPTVLTLDRSSSAPVATGNTALLGSMYYDTTSGRIQCYEADGWGACGSSPDNYVNLVPEYTGAVLNGTGIGTLTSDFCSNQSTVLQVNLSLCSTGQALNYYKWTSPQATQQTYSIYVSYQLPAAFKQFQSDSTIQLTARTDNVANGIVSYEMFRSQAGALSACGTETTVTSTLNTWQTVGINGNELTSCGFSSSSANNFAIFKINVKARSNANVYVGTLSFTTTGQ
ncbi:MAG TPA: carbohydrate binding domain-containing protein [Candidatus Saccharimonadales bacterium]|jgi:hypothetical protein